MTADELQNKINQVKLWLAVAARLTERGAKWSTVNYAIKLVNEINKDLEKEEKFLCPLCFKLEPIDRMEMQLANIRYEATGRDAPKNERACTCTACAKKYDDFFKMLNL